MFEITKFKLINQGCHKHTHIPIFLSVVIVFYYFVHMSVRMHALTTSYSINYRFLVIQDWSRCAVIYAMEWNTLLQSNMFIEI